MKKTAYPWLAAKLTRPGMENTAGNAPALTQTALLAGV